MQVESGLVQAESELERAESELEREPDWKHDLEHLLNPETGYLSPRCIQVDVTSGLVNVGSDFSLGIQH